MRGSVHYVNPDAERNEPDNSIWYARNGYETENRAAKGGDADFGRGGILKRKLHKSRNERERVNVRERPVISCIVKRARAKHQ